MNLFKVFTGAAAQELGSKEQSLAAFQRAIQISPNQAPAWQVLNFNKLFFSLKNTLLFKISGFGTASGKKWLLFRVDQYLQ